MQEKAQAIHCKAILQDVIVSYRAFGEKRNEPLQWQQHTNRSSFESSKVKNRTVERRVFQHKFMWYVAAYPGVGQPAQRVHGRQGEKSVEHGADSPEIVGAAALLLRLGQAPFIVTRGQSRGEPK